MTTFSLSSKQRQILLQLPVDKLFFSQSNLAGRHDNVQGGDESDFDEFKPYEFGDELRRIDWKTYLRTKRLYIKRFSNENAKQVYFFLDTSASMRDKDSKGLSAIIPIFFHYLQLHRENYGVVLFKENDYLFQEAKTGGLHLRKMEQLFNEILYTGKSDFNRLLLPAMQRLPMHSDVVFFSDFHFDLSLLHSMLKVARDRKLFFFFIVWLAPTLYQIRFNKKQSALHYLKDSEDGSSMFFSRLMLPQYKQLVAKHYAQLEVFCKKYALRHLKLEPQNDPFESFLHTFRHY